MVRRRNTANRIEDTAPRWVLRFEPEQWSTESWDEGWREWRAAVRTFANDNFLGVDVRAWLKVLSNIYATRNQHWADLARETTEQRS